MEKKAQYQCKDIVASGHTAVNMSRQCLLQWINETLSLKIRKIEDLCSGAVYCQLLDILFPGCIPLKKIKLEASMKNEYWSNFKQLQIAFRAVGCKKDVPINRLVEGRFQDNFEFLQWFKRFYDANDVDQPLVTSAKLKLTGQATPQPSTSKAQARPLSKPVAIVNPLQGNLHENELKSLIAEYQERAMRVQQEKDIFFNKLRRIELLCSADEAPRTKKKDFVEKILAELYASDAETELTEDDSQ